MTDRELLELAAKAAGLTDAKFQDMKGWGEVRYGLACAIWSETLGEYWNPLADDGDALRLAVKLNLSVQIECDSAGVVCVQWEFDQSGEAAGSVMQEAPVGGDDNAATRRAIVRAAAEIGRAMP